MTIQVRLREKNNLDLDSYLALIVFSLLYCVELDDKTGGKTSQNCQATSTLTCLLQFRNVIQCLLDWSLGSVSS